MPYTKSPRPYKHEYQMEKKRGEHPDRMERQRARRKLDKKGVNREGKDVAHVKALSKGGVGAYKGLHEGALGDGEIGRAHV